jgi:hypothetical protein
MLNRTWYIMFSDKRSQSINSVADWFGYDGVVMGVKNDKGTKLWVAGAGSKAEMNEGESAPYTVDTGCGHGRSGYVVADSAFKVGKDGEITPIFGNDKIQEKRNLWVFK